MVLFINDKPIKIVNKEGLKKLKGGSFDVMLDANHDSINFKKIVGNGLILNLDAVNADKIFEDLFKSNATSFNSLTLIVDKKRPIQQKIKSHFKVIKAAGGIVLNQKAEVLMMHRLHKWDLPKGKQDAGEKSKQTAVREVMEECNIAVQLGKKVCTTWHTYTFKGNNILKRTRWYEMICTDDSKMKPQLEENISELRWMDNAAIQDAMKNTYSSIKFVIESWTHSK